MKKLFTLTMLLLCAIVGAKAEAVTIGLTQTNDGVATGDYKGTLAAAVYTGATNLTVSEAHGAGCGINQSERKTTGPDGDYWATKCFRKTTKASAWESTTWVGYTFNVPTGYKVSLTNVKATLWDAASSTSFDWRVVIENSSGTALFTSGSQKSSTSSIGTLSVPSPSGVTDLKTGTYTVKLQLFQNGGNKYFTVPYLTVDASVEEDASASFIVTTSATPAAGGVVTPATGEQVEGEDVILTATPNTGYKFVKWTVDGTDYTTNPYTISNISAAHTAVATFEALPQITFNKGEGTGTAPSVCYAEAGSSFILPNAYFIYKEGATLTGWTDGTTTYAIGSSYSITGDVAFTAVFTANDVALGDAATTVNWTFATASGAPIINCEGSELDYVQNATISGKMIDVVMHINTTTGAAIPEVKGKVNNTSGDNRAQVNKGTLFTIPALKGMVITVTATNTGSASVSSMTFDGNNADSYSSGVLTYTYNGTESTINIIDQGNSLYPSGISVQYPLIPKVAPADPTFPSTTAVNGGSAVTITSEGITTYYQWSDTEVTLTPASAGWIEGTEAEVPNVTGTKFLYAYASNGTELNSEVVGQVFTITKTSAVVIASWDFTSWSAGTQAGMIADTEDWNQFEKTGETGNNFENKGRSNVSALSNNTLKYSETIIPETAGLKFTAGAYGLAIIYDEDEFLNKYHGASYIWLYNSNTKITIPDVPAGATIAIGVETHKNSDARGITLSNATQTVGNATSKNYQECEWTVNSAGDITITPNKGLHIYFIRVSVTAPETISKTISAAGYATLCSEYPLDFTGSGLKAYIATVSSQMVTFTEVTSVPANTGVLLKGTEGDKTIAVAASSTDVSANQLVGVLTDTPVAAGIFVLMNGENGVGFYKTTNTFTVGANTAYLPASVAEGRAFIGFADEPEATGINEVKTMKASNDIYNLKGLKVKNAQKGLYIIGGKKVVMK